MKEDLHCRMQLVCTIEVPWGESGGFSGGRGFIYSNDNFEKPRLGTSLRVWWF